ncbi:MAG: response regulator [Saprospiraceae bacterium]|nr:response regulator [Saprospiraceae bacterium]
MDKIKIGIVDDEKLFIKGMQMIINGEADLTVTYQAENGSRFLDDIAAGKADVDIVLLDLSMPIMDGVDVLLKTASMNLPFKIIVLTSTTMTASSSNFWMKVLPASWPKTKIPPPS